MEARSAFISKRDDDLDGGEDRPKFGQINRDTMLRHPFNYAVYTHTFIPV